MFRRQVTRWGESQIAQRQPIIRKQGKSRTSGYRPRLEVLEDRTLLSLSMGVTFDNGSGVVGGEIEVRSFSWGATNSAMALPKLQDFQMVLASGQFEPQVWGTLATGTHFSQVVLHVRGFTPSGSGSFVEYLTYKFNNVSISSFQTSGQDSPVAGLQDQVDAFTLNF